MTHFRLIYMIWLTNDLCIKILAIHVNKIVTCPDLGHVWQLSYLKLLIRIPFLYWLDMKVALSFYGRSNKTSLNWFGRNKNTKSQASSRITFITLEKKTNLSLLVLDLSIDHLNSFAISSSADNQICKYSLATGDIIKKITIKKSGIAAVSIRPDNKIFASGGHDGRFDLLNRYHM